VRAEFSNTVDTFPGEHIVEESALELHNPVGTTSHPGSQIQQITYRYRPLVDRPIAQSQRRDSLAIPVNRIGSSISAAMSFMAAGSADLVIRVTPIWCFIEVLQGSCRSDNYPLLAHDGHRMAVISQNPVFQGNAVKQGITSALFAFDGGYGDLHPIVAADHKGLIESELNLAEQNTACFSPEQAHQLTDRHTGTTKGNQAGDAGIDSEVGGTLHRVMPQNYMVRLQGKAPLLKSCTGIKARYNRYR
jgi:hypothetical protein